jgi:hypothetical protein
MRAVGRMQRPDYKNAERRYDQYGEFRLMVEAEGYVMFRRHGAGPHVMSRKAWDALSMTPIRERHLVENSSRK